MVHEYSRRSFAPDDNLDDYLVLMSKLRKKANQIIRLWDDTMNQQEREDLIYHALKISAGEIIDWTTRFVKPYTDTYDNGIKAKEYMAAITKFKESL